MATPQAEQNQPEQEKFVAAATGKSPSYAATPRIPYARSASHQSPYTPPISVFVTIEDLPEITDSKIDGILKESFAAIFATDEEAQILSLDQTSHDPPLTKSSDLSRTNLRPVFATNPRFLKKLPDGRKKYEFNCLMTQGNLTFHDLRYEDLVKQVLRDFTMTWTASNIRGPDRACIGWLYGKHSNFFIMTNFKDSIRRDMPKDAPGFDFRIEPETYYQGSAVGPCCSKHDSYGRRTVLYLLNGGHTCERAETKEALQSKSAPRRHHSEDESSEDERPNRKPKKKHRQMTGPYKDRKAPHCILQRAWTKYNS